MHSVSFLPLGVSQSKQLKQNTLSNDVKKPQSMVVTSVSLSSLVDFSVLNIVGKIRDNECKQLFKISKKGLVVFRHFGAEMLRIITLGLIPIKCSIF